MLIHDNIKIRLTREGYLPNYPYHMISDSEMFDAFIKDDGTGIFYYKYPLLDTQLEDQYKDIIDAILYHISVAKNSNRVVEVLPDWVYSYMIESTISVYSDKRDIHDLLVPLGVDNLDDEFDAAAQAKCYEVSKDWVNKEESKLVWYKGREISTRPPTLFGEPHVVKSLRLQILDPIGR